jgi:hypothetical protein
VTVSAQPDGPDPAQPRFSTGVPAPARIYDYCLGGKDNFAVDREAVLAVCAQIPEALDMARSNRRFLYRVVRFLARDAGVGQFIDLGSGLPTQANVHEVAQRFRPAARVVYVDIDPVVLSHGRALLADDKTTTVITADMTAPHKIVTDPDALRLIDFSEPVAALFLSVAQNTPDDAQVRDMLVTMMDALAPGSYLAFSHIVGPDKDTVDSSNELARKIMTNRGMPWKNRTRAEVAGLLRGLQPVEPGLVGIDDWHPDRFEPKPLPVDAPLQRYIGASAAHKLFSIYGGVLLKT